MNTANVRDIEMAYEMRGDGESIVLVHAAPDPDGIRPLMDASPLRGHRMMRYRRRNYLTRAPPRGPVTVEQNAQDLAGLLDALGIERAHIVGHSYGARVALELARQHPERARSLVLMDPALFFQVESPQVRELEKSTMGAVERYRAGDKPGAVDAFLEGAFGEGYRKILDEATPGWHPRSLASADAWFGAELPGSRGWRFGDDDARRLEMPVTCLRGARSHPAFADFEDLLGRWFPQLRRTVLPGLGHALYLQDPIKVAEAVARAIG